MLVWPSPQVAPTGRHMSSMSVRYDLRRASMLCIMPSGVSSFSYSSVIFSGHEAKPMNHLSRLAALARAMAAPYISHSASMLLST